MTFPRVPFQGVAVQCGTINVTATPTTTGDFNRTGPITFAAVTGAGGASCVNVMFTPVDTATSLLGVCVPVGASPITVQCDRTEYDIEYSTDAGTAVLHWFAAG